MDHQSQVKRLLVPLDGSSLAQTVIPAVASFAQAFGAQAILIHVLERNPAETVHGEKHLTDSQDALRYLDDVAQKLCAEGISVETHVHETREGDIPLSIVQHAEEYSPDLIVLCAHGKHGLKSFISGRVGQQVLLRGKCPVLILQPDKTPFSVRSVVVPVDSEHAQGTTLGFAAMLAKGFDAELHAVSVVPTLATLDMERSRTGLFLPSAMRAILDMDQEAESEELQSLVASYQNQGIKASALVLRGNTVGEVLKRSNELESCLVVMATHGSIGLEAFVAGSIAPRIAAKIRVPLLLMREE